MLALAYDAALRREELCLLATDDLDPAHRTLRVRAETAKTRRGRVVPYSAVGGQLLAGYLPASPLDHSRAGRVVRVRVAAQLGGSRSVEVDVVKSGPLDRGPRRGTGVQHAHAAASVSDRSRAVGVGTASDHDVRGTSKHADDAEVHPSIGPRARSEKLRRRVAEIHAQRVCSDRRGARMSAVLLVVSFAVACCEARGWERWVAAPSLSQWIPANGPATRGAVRSRVTRANRDRTYPPRRCEKTGEQISALGRHRFAAAGTPRQSERMRRERPERSRA